MFEVLIERRAERDLAQFDRGTRERIVPVLQGLAADPWPHGCRKLAGSVNDWRIRVGDYRILYEIDKKSRSVRVMAIRHRREAYR